MRKSSLAYICARFMYHPRIGFIQQPLSQSRAIAGNGIRRLPFPDEPILPVDGDVILYRERKQFFRFQEFFSIRLERRPALMFSPTV